MFSTTDLRLLPIKCDLNASSSVNRILHTSHLNLQRRTHFHKEMKSKSMCCESISCSWKRTDWILFHQVTHQTKHQHECENHFPVQFPLKEILFINIWGIPQQGIGLPWLRGSPTNVDDMHEQVMPVWCNSEGESVQKRSVMLRVRKGTEHGSCCLKDWHRNYEEIEIER